MKLQVRQKVYNRINRFYYNACLKYPNTYFPDDAERDINKVYDELPKVGTLLQHRNTCILQRWRGYLVDYSKATKWYFAYLKNNELMIYVYDAENVRNMSDLARMN